MSSKKKKKGAFGWFQGGLENKKETSEFTDVEKNIEIFNHNMGNEGSSEATVAEAFEDMVNNPETNLQAIHSLNKLVDI